MAWVVPMLLMLVPLLQMANLQATASESVLKGVKRCV